MARREIPGPDQESVWDYPRPPRIERSDARVIVELAGVRIVDTQRSIRVLETSHPPVHYLCPDDFPSDVLQPATGPQSWCEFKGTADYVDLAAGDRVARSAGWRYLNPTAGYVALDGWVALYPGRVDAVWLAGERVRAQDGDFYGGWITSRVTGPFKGAPGTRGW